MKSEFMVAKNTKWIPQNILFYCLPMDLFKCSLPLDEVVESYLHQIQEFASLELIEEGEKIDLCSASEIQ